MMDAYHFQGKKVHYELIGKGHPLLLLNSIMMSAKSWTPFLKAFEEGGNQLILVDMLD